MTTSIWDDPKMKVNDDYMRFVDVGDTITGRVISVGQQTFDDGKTHAQLIVDTGTGERTVTASQYELKKLVAAARPEAGDTITITHTSVENLSGGKTMKHFDVAVNKPAQAANDPWADLTPEQVASLKSAGILPA
jgi:predicted ATP-grasp superfamily ATP-dependent carboligase